MLRLAGAGRGGAPTTSDAGTTAVTVDVTVAATTGTNATAVAADATDQPDWHPPVGPTCVRYSAVFFGNPKLRVKSCPVL